MRRMMIVLALLFTMLLTGLTVSAQQTVHVVQPGENLYRISLRYNISYYAIASANGISNVNLIYAGQQLIIPTGGGQPQPPPQPTQVPGQPVPGDTTYIVARGDTLAGIARRFGTTYPALAQLNGITNPNLIYVGQTLRISGSGGQPQPQPTQVPGQPTVPPPSGGGAFELGGQVLSFAYPDQMRSAGMTWAKSQVVWNRGDSINGAKEKIDAARARGFKILLSIKGDKNQLAQNPTQYYQDFANYLGEVAKLSPDAIEVWNEQNIDREWPAGQINGAGYTQMLSAAYQAIKRNNPNVMVISGAPAPTGFFGGKCTGAGCDDAAYLQQMAAAGAGNYFDCLGIHYNEGILPPSATSGDPRGNSGHYTRYYPTMVSTYRSIFPNKQLCFTEIGYLSPEGFGPLPAGFEWGANTTVQQQAEWLAQAVRQARNSGAVRLFIVWNVDATVYGADPQAGYAIVRGNQCLACITIGAAMGN